MITLFWNDDTGAAVSVEFDADLQETHEFQTQITEHPVEEGADIADHMQDQLDRFTIEGFVTDSPIGSNPGVQEIAEIRSIEIQVPGGSARTAMMLTFDDFASRKRAALDLLDGARRAHRTIWIITSMRDYSNMYIEQMTVTRAPENGNGAKITVVLKEVRKVSAQLVDAPTPAEKIGSTKKATGSKNAGADKANIQAKKQSAAAKIADAGSKWLENNGVSSLFE